MQLLYTKAFRVTGDSSVGTPIIESVSENSPIFVQFPEVLTPEARPLIVEDRILFFHVQK
jgi:hypothetical protein